MENLPATHFCMVAKEFVPNLSPLLDSRFAVKEAVLFYTADFLPQANHLSASYKAYGIKSRLVVLPDAFDMEKLAASIEPLVLEYMDKGACLNATCGTKPMSLVLYQLGVSAGLPVYYLDSDDRLVWLSPKDWAPMQIEDRIKIPHFLRARGLELLAEDIPSADIQYRKLLDIIITNLPHFQKAIAQLNYYAYTASAKTLASAKLQNPSSAFRELIELFADAGLLRQKQGCLHFVDSKARFFANGGWLEEFLHHQIRQLSAKIPQIQDYKMSAEVQNLQNAVRNEIDNLVLCNNHLFVIECKTKRFGKDQKPDGGATQAIYKLHTLATELGGALTKGMLVSVFPLGKAEQERARQYNITLLQLEDLQDIKQHLSRWFTQ